MSKPTFRYRSPKDRHRHQCGVCLLVWEHADAMKFVAEAHVCPGCGSFPLDWPQYDGDEPPSVHDERVGRKGQDDVAAE